MTGDVKISRYRSTGEKDSDGRDLLQVMLTCTPFYGESGGQIGDTGTIVEIGFVRVLLEGSISAGIRRIEAVTGQKAYEHAARNEVIPNEISGYMKCVVDEVPNRLAAMIDRMKQLQKENEWLIQKALASEADGMVRRAVKHEGARIVTEIVEVGDVDSLKNLVHGLRSKMGRGVYVLGAAINGKGMLVVGVTDDLVGKGVKSGNIIKHIAAIIGGGHPKLARAGGKNPEKLKEAIAASLKIVKQNL